MTLQEYRNEVARLAEQVQSEVREHGHDLSDVLHETVDCHSFIIYHYNARKVVEHSDNDCALFEDMGPIEVTDWSTLFTQAAYFALYQDVYDAIAE